MYVCVREKERLMKVIVPGNSMASGPEKHVITPKSNIFLKLTLLLFINGANLPQSNAVASVYTITTYISIIPSLSKTTNSINFTRPVHLPESLPVPVFASVGVEVLAEVGSVSGGAGDDADFAVEADEAVHVEISRPAQESPWSTDIMPQPLPLLVFGDFHDDW